MNKLMQQDTVKYKRLTISTIPKVMEIEKVSFRHPWKPGDFFRCLRSPSVNSIVSHCDNHVAGYLIYQIEQGGFELCSVAVAPMFRRQKIGQKLVARFLMRAGDRPVVADVAEENLGGQLFFQQCGWRCTRIVRDAYDNCDGDAYRFYCIKDMYDLQAAN